MVKIRSASSDYDTPEEMFLAMKNKTAQDWHMYHVFKDPEYIAANKALLDAYGIDTHTLGVWDDSLVPPGKEAGFWKDQQQLADSYRISLDDWKLSHRLPPAYYRYRNIVRLGYDQDRGVVKIEVKPTVTEKEIRSLYGAVQRIAYLYQVDKPKSPRKAPKDPALVYALFKARQRKAKFTEIYKEYECNKLAYYKLGEQKFYSGKELADYYRAHGPEKYQ